MRRFAAVLLVVGLAGVVSASAPAERERAWARVGTVVRVVSGDTVDVRLATGARERVRLLGVRAPPAGSCFAAQARTATRTLAGRRTVTLSADRSIPTRDRAGRLLAYVRLGRRGDLGGVLLGRGLAQVDVDAPPFGRFLSYAPVQRLAETGNRGIWRTCAADVDVAIAASPTEPVVGGQVAYRVTVTNHGPLAAPGAVLELRPPTATPLASADSGACRVQAWVGTCSFGRLAARATVTATFTADVTRAGLASARVAARFGWCIRAACGTAPLRDRNARNGESAALVTAVAPARRSTGCKSEEGSECAPDG